MIILVSIVNQNENAEKLEIILDAAQRCFAQYGLSKTTMTDIAGESGLSKAALYYYFPDKIGLFRAVIEREHRYFMSDMNELITSKTDAEKLLLEYNTRRMVLSQKMLAVARLEMPSSADTAKPLVADILRNLIVEEEKMIAKIIQGGIKGGLFQKTDAVQMASVFIDGYRGLRMTMKEKHGLYPSGEGLEETVEKLTLYTKIFIKGLKK